MKNQIQTILGVLAMISACPTATFAADAAKPECTTVIEHLTTEVKKDPTRLLLVVEDALTLNDKCACEIVSTAIEISKADAELVGRIVTTSVQAAPTAASTIAECALAASPTSSAAIKKAMKNALGQGDTSAESAESTGKEVVGKEPVSSGKEVVGKEPVGKLPVAPLAEDNDDPDFVAPIDTAGVYLFTPAGGGIVVEREKETKVIIRRETKVIRRVIRESTHSTCNRLAVP